MNKVLISMIGLVALTGCATKYDYFRGDIRYVQDGRDCIYYASEYGENFNDGIRDMDNGKKIVYRDTMCADLYARDNADADARHDRARIVPAFQETKAPAPCAQKCPAKTCGCAEIGNQGPMILRRRYIIMPAM